MSCPRCTTNTSFVTAADRTCAFDAAGRFVSRNANCGTMHALVGLAPFKISADPHVFSASIGFDGAFLVLAWRSGARIAYAEVLVSMGDGDAIRASPLTLSFAERLIAAKTARARET